MTPAAAARGRPAQPWQPEPEEARRLLEDELAKDRYQAAQPNPVLEWIGDRFDELLDWLDSLGQGVAGVPSWVLPALLVVVAVVVLILVRPRANARGRRRDSAMLTERVSTPADHRAAAERAHARSDHGQALVSWFRAAVREAEVRTVVDERPGRTASEAARELARVFPQEQAELHRVAEAFNAVLYDHATATAEQALAARDLDRRLAAAPAPAASASDLAAAR